MALTGAQKVRIRRYLGYTADTNLLDDEFAGLSADAEAEVVAVLAEIAALRGALTDSDAATFSKVEDVTFRDTGGRAEGEIARLIGELAAMLGVDITRTHYQGAVTCGPILRG